MAASSDLPEAALSLGTVLLMGYFGLKLVDKFRTPAASSAGGTATSFQPSVLPPSAADFQAADQGIYTPSYLVSTIPQHSVGD